jgi:hypothetical protein
MSLHKSLGADLPPEITDELMVEFVGSPRPRSRSGSLGGGTTYGSTFITTDPDPDSRTSRPACAGVNSLSRGSWTFTGRDADQPNELTADPPAGLRCAGIEAQVESDRSHTVRSPQPPPPKYLGPGGHRAGTYALSGVDTARHRWAGVSLLHRENRSEPALLGAVWHGRFCTRNA